MTDVPCWMLIPELCAASTGLPDSGLVEEIELVGLCTGICVISNAFILKAKLPEVRITVDSSCCACVTPQSHETALSAMKLCQINVK